MQADLIVLESSVQAVALLDPARAQLLEHLRDPDSAAGAARALGLPRQRIGYHLRELERAGLLQLVGERRQRNCVERLFQATARRYVIGPSAVPGAPPADDLRDRFSSEYLVAAAARLIQDVGALQRLARAADTDLPTLTIDADIRFASPEASHAFATELARSIATLVDKYHDESAPHGRRFRVVAAAHPSLPAASGPSAGTSASPLSTP
jgi:DNA-binding transcriptional ArsR family regulator